MGVRTENSIKNAYSGLFLKIATILLKFLSRVVFIKFLGENCLGLNDLFTTLLTLFSLAELGIGEAITFYLYDPISKNDKERLTQLVHFYKVCYRVIGSIIFGVGILIIPILPKLVNFETDTGYNLYFLYILYLLNTVITYPFFSYPQTILNANQKQYVINKNNTLFTFVIFISDIVSLSLTKNYIVYLLLRMALVIVQNLRLYIKTRKEYDYVSLVPENKLDKHSLRNMFKDIYYIFILKIASRLIDSTDNVFISLFLGTVKVGFNSNYLIITDAVSGIISTLVYSFSAGVGDYNASNKNKSSESLYHLIDLLNFCVSFTCSIFLFSLFNPFITLIWGEHFIFSDITVALLCFNFYIVSSMFVVFMFRQSLGLFKYSVWFNVCAAILNVILDFLFVNKLGVAGLYLATVISNLSFGVWPFVKNVFNIGFNKSSKNQILKMVFRYVYLLLFGFVVYFACSNISNSLVGFIFKALIALGLSIIGVVLALIFDRSGKELINKAWRIIRK